jgi:hypothetical protein
MTKVIIDAFDTPEQAVAFISWLKDRMDEGINLINILGIYVPEYDGMDTSRCNTSQLVMNITISSYNQLENVYD